MSSDTLLNKDYVQLKQRMEILQNTYIFFHQLKAKSITQDQILDTIERDVEPLLTKIKKPQLLGDPNALSQK